ncbi:hypothetical protein T552_03145 [Pneumocystis carinii B80]|uniref:Plus3 domain-containing protein n=1 Tax=Pneumocystis carinii (strain B80) TaxID=1408658 RepID=A0A0W4ZBS0_PNEC8|nr:hypothetical protein T552_03145 [Pneumocystis carinii B80]KTW25871.1 hypothetical protein T552_03145 [Pneumocystis carinii B80]
MIDDLSDELLALAGHKDIETSLQKKKSGHKKKTSQKRSQDKKYNGNYKKSLKSNDDSNDELYSSEYSTESENMVSKEDDNDYLEEYAIPYVLEGKFKDEEDRKRIMDMNEVERESILYEREEETQKLQEKKELAKRLRQEKLSVKKELKIRQSTRETKGKGEETTSKRDKLIELKRKREEKSNRTDSKLDDKTFNKRTKNELDKKYESKNDSKGFEDKKESAALDLNDVNNTRLARTHFAKFLFHPLFEGVIVGCFARVKIGENSQGKSVYRVCQVKGLQPSTKIYSFEGILSNQKLECIHGASVKTFEITFVSNSAITQNEFDKWTQQLKEDKIATPKKSLIEKKITELSLMTQHKLTDLEISDMIARRKALQKIPRNIAIEKTQLKKTRDIAIAHGDEKEAQRLTEKLNTLEELSEKRRYVLTNSDKFAKLNEKNRKANLDTIRQAEIQANKERREKDSSPILVNPFSRLKTNPKIFYDNILEMQGSTLPKTDNSNKNTETVDTCAKTNTIDTKKTENTNIPENTSKIIKTKTLNNIDEIISQSNFDLDFDI